jgi:DNA-binding CsgD family transcriptional regulator
LSPTISSYLLELHRASRRMRHFEFREWVFDELRAIVQFDSAFWYRWAASETESKLHAWYLYRQPESLIEDYASEELWRDDIVYARALAAPPGTAIYASYDDYTSERMRAFLRRHRQSQVLTIAYLQDIPRVAGGMSLYRNETREPYTRVDAADVEAVAGHVIDAWRENWLDDLMRSTSTRREQPEFSLAVLMPDQMMSEAQDNFGKLMRLEWPQWQGPWLPATLVEHWERSQEAWVGRAVTAYRRVQPDQLTLILIRRGHPLDTLAPRKRAVARLFAHGASQTEVAKRLSLSSSTVNNYLGDVYQHLNICDKVELARLVEWLEP